MANFRPAGMSDEDSDSDDDYEKFNRRQYYPTTFVNVEQKTETKLQEAIVSGNIETVADIIRSDLQNDINGKLKSGWTPLSHACFLAQEKIVQYLLEKGATPNVHADSIMPIMLACTNTSANETKIFSIVSSLIKHRTVLNIGDKYGITPLMKATISGRPYVVKLIINSEGNIEMRDCQGWTAVFWAVHHNQSVCLDILLSKGARLNIVDKSNRSPQLIAISHGHKEVQDVISKYTKISENEADMQDNREINTDSDDISNLTNWQDYYPGLRDEKKPRYSHEIPHLLYGMNCDRLRKIFEKNPMDLRQFLLLEDEDMLKLNIDMPFERQRLKQGLRAFHTRGWKVNAVAGLQTGNNTTYSILDCLNILGSHLQQLYVLDATFAYILRDYSRIQNQIKFEPPNSPIIERLRNVTKKITANINYVREEINDMKKLHARISKLSIKPVDLITEKTTKEVALELLTKVIVLSSLGVLLYHAKNVATNMLRK